MGVSRKSYSENHWLRWHDPEAALAAYMEQQSKTYSRIKNAFIRELLGNLKGKRFLDYGCGAGFFTVHAAQQGALEIVAIDAEERALATARYFCAQQRVEHLCNFIHSEEFPTLKFRPRFDVILMKDVIEHVPNDTLLLHKVAEALVPGGIIVLSTQNLLSLNYLLEGTYQRILLRNKDWYGWDETHLRFYTAMSLKEKLDKVGLKAINWRSVYLIPYKLPSLPSSGKKFFRIDMLAYIDKLLGGVFPFNRLGWNIIVKAKASGLVVERTRIEHPMELIVAGLNV